MLVATCSANSIPGATSEFIFIRHVHLHNLNVHAHVRSNIRHSLFVVRSNNFPLLCRRDANIHLPAGDTHRADRHVSLFVRGRVTSRRGASAAVAAAAADAISAASAVIKIACIFNEEEIYLAAKK